MRRASRDRGAAGAAAAPAAAAVAAAVGAATLLSTGSTPAAAGGVALDAGAAGDPAPVARMAGAVAFWAWATAQASTRRGAAASRSGQVIRKGIAVFYERSAPTHAVRAVHLHHAPHHANQPCQTPCPYPWTPQAKPGARQSATSGAPARYAAFYRLYEVLPSAPSNLALTSAASGVSNCMLCWSVSGPWPGSMRPAAS